MVDACLAHFGPVFGELVVARVPPVVEDLMGNLGDQLRALGGFVARVVRGRDIFLREHDAGMLEEDVDKPEEPGDDGADENDGGDEAESNEERLEADPHLRDRR